MLYKLQGQYVHMAFCPHSDPINIPNQTSVLIVGDERSHIFYFLSVLFTTIDETIKSMAQCNWHSRGV